MISPGKTRVSHIPPPLLVSGSMALFEAGELRRAMLAFEAEVQRAPDNAEAWRMLGTCRVIYVYSPK